MGLLLRVPLKGTIRVLLKGSISVRLLMMGI